MNSSTDAAFTRPHTLGSHTARAATLRVTFVNKAAAFGGQEKYLILLATELARAGACVSFEGGPPQVKAALAQLSGSPCAPPIRREVIVYNGNRALYTSLFAKRRAATKIYVQHSLSSDSQSGGWRRSLRHLLLRLALRRVDAAVRVCDVALPADWKRDGVWTVHNGVDLDEFPCRSSWREDPSSMFTCLMVGAVNRNKNQRMAIEALAHAPGVRLVIVGDGPERVALEDLAIQLGVSSRIEWAGSDPHPARRYQTADVYLMLSHFEAMPFVMLEAMASGTPVVAVPVGGIREVVTDGVDGVLLSSGHAASLAAALCKLASNPELVRDMGQRARATVDGRFRVQHMASGFLDVLARAERRHDEGTSK